MPQHHRLPKRPQSRSARTDENHFHARSTLERLVCVGEGPPWSLPFLHGVPSALADKRHFHQPRPRCFVSVAHIVASYCVGVAHVLSQLWRSHRSFADILFMLVMVGGACFGRDAPVAYPQTIDLISNSSLAATAFLETGYIIGAP